MAFVGVGWPQMFRQDHSQATQDTLDPRCKHHPNFAFIGQNCGAIAGGRGRRSNRRADDISHKCPRVPAGYRPWLCPFSTSVGHVTGMGLPPLPHSATQSPGEITGETAFFSFFLFAPFSGHTKTLYFFPFGCEIRVTSKELGAICCAREVRRKKRNERCHPRFSRTDSGDVAHHNNVFVAYIIICRGSNLIRLILGVGVRERES